MQLSLLGSDRSSDSAQFHPTFPNFDQFPVIVSIRLPDRDVKISGVQLPRSPQSSEQSSAQICLVPSLFYQGALGLWLHKQVCDSSLV